MATKAKAKSSKTKPKTTRKRSSSKKKAETPAVIEVNDQNARSDDDALVGHFVEVRGGDHDGRYGVLDSVSTPDKDGYPTKCVVITRDDDNARLVVNYKDVFRAGSGRR